MPPTLAKSGTRCTLFRTNLKTNTNIPEGCLLSTQLSLITDVSNYICAFPLQTIREARHTQAIENFLILKNSLNLRYHIFCQGTQNILRIVSFPILLPFSIFFFFKESSLKSGNLSVIIVIYLNTRETYPIKKVFVVQSQEKIKERLFLAIFSFILNAKHFIKIQ